MERGSLGTRAHSTVRAPLVKHKNAMKMANYSFSDNAVQCRRFWVILQACARNTRGHFHIAATGGPIEALVQCGRFRFADARLPLASREQQPRKPLPIEAEPSNLLTGVS